MIKEEKRACICRRPHELEVSEDNCRERDIRGGFPTPCAIVGTGRPYDVRCAEGISGMARNNMCTIALVCLLVAAEGGLWCFEVYHAEACSYRSKQRLQGCLLVNFVSKVEI